MSRISFQRYKILLEQYAIYKAIHLGQNSTHRGTRYNAAWDKIQHCKIHQTCLTQNKVDGTDRIADKKCDMIVNVLPLPMLLLVLQMMKL